MEEEKYIVMMNQYLKGNIKMEIEMEQEKNFSKIY